MASSPQRARLLLFSIFNYLSYEEMRSLARGNVPGNEEGVDQRSSIDSPRFFEEPGREQARHDHERQELNRDNCVEGLCRAEQGSACKQWNILQEQEYQEPGRCRADRKPVPRCTSLSTQLELAV